NVLFWTLAGMVIFFVLESTLRWFHHHHEHHEHRTDPNASLVVIGDTVHNFIDGVAIAAAFLISVPTGIVTTLAVAAHEIPQEIGDFGLLLSKGYSRRQVLKVNIYSALATTVGAVIFFKLGTNNPSLIGALIGMTAGFFIYIATSDIIPSIHDAKDKRSLYIKSLLLVVGVVIVGTSTTLAHNYINADQHNQPAASQQHSD
ncbi:MAG: ZIP family metal transporter, partial [Candidatus Saccharimonadales bacterium]